MEKRKCTGDVDECFKCGLYYSSWSPHREIGRPNEVVTIDCCYGTGGTFDAETRERIK